MATYKVIQDIEAEDKLLGPLSFRQFVYFFIGGFLGYLNFMMVVRGAPWALFILGPPFLFCMFFAWPWSADQSTEVWALARIRFLFKPRKRIWNQSGVKELVTITAPVKIERNYTDGLSQTEVRSRLSALADTLDSRGWAIKNSGNLGMPLNPNDDRLVAITAAPQEVTDIRDSDDVLDPRFNPAAYQVDRLIEDSTRNHRQKLMDMMQQPTPQPAAPAQPQWFARTAAPGAPVATVTPSTPALPPMPPQPTPVAVAPPTTPPVAAAPVTPPASEADTLPAPQPKATDNMRTLQPLATTPPPTPAVTQTTTPTPVSPDPAILTLAHNDNLNVATIAREADRSKRKNSGSLGDEEVVVSLH